MLIREAVSADAEVLGELLRVLGYPADAGLVRERLEAFTRGSKGTVLVGELDGAVVAFAALLVYTPLHTDGPTAHLTAFAVSSKHQRQGIGEQMIRQVESWARERRCRKIVVTSAEHRGGAHAFYPAVGWGYTGRRYGTSLDHE